jgi:hypothetical protein
MNLLTSPEAVEPGDVIIDPDTSIARGEVVDVEDHGEAVLMTYFDADDPVNYAEGSLHGLPEVFTTVLTEPVFVEAR